MPVSNWDLVIVATGASVGQQRGLYNRASAMSPATQRALMSLHYLSNLNTIYRDLTVQVSVITSFSNHHLGGGVRTETINHLLAFAWFDSLVRFFYT